MELNFRKLKASEIDVRVQSVTATYFILLLYKDARVDMSILDETVGAMSWQREHKDDYCIVSIFDKDLKQWVYKQDVGTESNTEKSKGLASDSFKRACVNWGIGRELYTSPFIFIKDTSYISSYNNKNTVKEKFRVSSIDYIDNEISYLEIVDSKGKKIFTWSNNYKKSEPAIQTDYNICPIGQVAGTPFDKINIDTLKTIQAYFLSPKGKDKFKGECSKYLDIIDDILKKAAITKAPEEAIIDNLEDEYVYDESEDNFDDIPTLQKALSETAEKHDVTMFDE